MKRSLPFFFSLLMALPMDDKFMLAQVMLV